jgi:hypothetical protein
MDWLARLSQWRGGRVFYVFECRLAAFAAPEEGEGVVSTLWLGLVLYIENSTFFLPIRNVFVCSKLLRNKTKLLVVQKFFGNRPEQNVLDKNVLGLIKNVSFRSRILFKKRIYSIFFGTKAAKRKLPKAIMLKGAQAWDIRRRDFCSNLTYMDRLVRN